MILAVSNNIATRCIFGRKVEEEEENGSGESKFGELTKKYMILRQALVLEICIPF